MMLQKICKTGDGAGPGQDEATCSDETAALLQHALRKQTLACCASPRVTPLRSQVAGLLHTSASPSQRIQGYDGDATLFQTSAALQRIPSRPCSALFYG